MFDRFTDRARKVMGFARQASDRFHHDHIGTEHILLGLIEEGSGVAVEVLKNLQIDPERVRLEVEKRLKRGPEVGEIGQMPFTERARKVLDYAMEEARSVGLKYVGTEHLLLGLLRVEDGKAAEVLTGLGLSLDEVRREVKELLGDEPVVDKFTVSPSGVEKFTQSPAGDISLVEMEGQVENWHAQAETARDHLLAARLRYLLDYLKERMEGREGSPDSAD